MQAQKIPPLSGAAMGPEVEPEPLLGVVWHRRWTVLIVTLASVAAGFMYLSQAVPIYTSTSRLYVEQQGPRIVTEYEGMMTQSKNYLYTQCELLKSTPTLAEAIEMVRAKRLKTFAGIDNPIGYLKSILKAQVGRQNDIISLSCESPHPEEAARIVNAVVDAYITYHSKRRRTTAAEVLRILQASKAKRDRELADNLKAILDFKKSNGALSFKNDQGNIVTQRLARLGAALTQAQLERIEADSTHKTIDEMKNGRGGGLARFRSLLLAGDNRNGQLAANISPAREKLVELSQSFTDEHPIVQAAKAKIARLEQDLEAHYKDLEAQHLAKAQHRCLAAKQKEAQIQALFHEQQRLGEKLNVLAATYAVLESNLRRTERLCDIIDNRIKEINVTEDVGALNISILEVARPGDDPTSPRKSRTMAMTLVLGMMLGIGLALVRDKMDHTLRSSEEILAITGTPVLGLVPSISGKHTDIERGQRTRLERTSHAAEAYRTIRTAVYFGVPGGEGKTLLVTSPAPGEGKSTLVSNLGIAMAQAGQRTLVVDGDFRRPTQHKIFETKNDDGLSSVLVGKTKLDDAIQHTVVDNLDVLPCGPIPPNPSEILNSRACADFIEQAAQQYEHILIDSPPVMPFADARILGAMCDVTLLVLRAETTTRKPTEEACETLRAVGAHVLGAVVNAVAPHRGRYGYYGYGYRYYGHYGYGYGRRKEHEDDSRSDAEAESGSGD